MFSSKSRVLLACLLFFGLPFACQSRPTAVSMRVSSCFHDWSADHMTLPFLTHVRGVRAAYVNPMHAVVIDRIVADGNKVQPFEARFHYQDALDNAPTISSEFSIDVYTYKSDPFIPENGFWTFMSSIEPSTVSSFNVFRIPVGSKEIVIDYRIREVGGPPGAIHRLRSTALPYYQPRARR